jgi:hypothetical protein
LAGCWHLTSDAAPVCRITTLATRPGGLLAIGSKHVRGTETQQTASLRCLLG